MKENSQKLSNAMNVSLWLNRVGLVVTIIIIGYSTCCLIKEVSPLGLFIGCIVGVFFIRICLISFSKEEVEKNVNRTLDISRKYWQVGSVITEEKSRMNILIGTPLFYNCVYAVFHFVILSVFKTAQ